MGNSIFLTLPGPWRIPIQLDTSLIMLVVIYLGISGSSGADISNTLVFIALIIISILLHELGHAWACVVQGIPVARIVLHGGGGFCQHRSATSWKQDELIVICGPIVNIAIWAIANLVMQWDGWFVTQTFTYDGQTFEAEVPSRTYYLLESMALINLVLGILNLLPALPLDGGRLLQAFLNRFTGPGTAARITGGVGLVMAILWIPMMIVAFLTLGFMLLFFPPILLHWRMMRGEQIG